MSSSMGHKWLPRRNGVASLGIACIIGGAARLRRCSPILCLLPDVVLVCYNSRLDWSKLMLMHTDWSSVVLNPLLKRRSVLLRDDPSGVGGLVGRRVCLPHTQQCFLPRFVVTVHPVEAPLTAVEAPLAGSEAWLGQAPPSAQ